MEQVAAIIRKINALETTIKETSAPGFVRDWLEENGWRYLGGRWANLDFQNPCFTWTTRQAVRIQLFRLLLAYIALAPLTETQWMRTIQEIAK